MPIRARAIIFALDAKVAADIALVMTSMPQKSRVQWAHVVGKPDESMLADSCKCPALLRGVDALVLVFSEDRIVGMTKSMVDDVLQKQAVELIRSSG